MSKLPKDIVTHVLANATDLNVVKAHVAEDATYVSLNYNDPDLQKIEPWCGYHDKAGPQAIHETFVNVGTYWTIEKFETYAVIGEGEDVAVFGRFRYKSNTLGKITDSPFAIWAKVDQGTSKITYMQFMEDSFSTAASFKKSGKAIFCSNPDTKEEFEIDFEHVT